MNDHATRAERPLAARLRRSRLLPRLLWLSTWLTSAVSVRLAGWVATSLWFVPWQDRGRVRAGRAAHPDATPVVVDAGGHRLHGFAAGTGPTVLLVHGWADQAASLSGFATPLVERGYRVVAVDLPAHGDSGGSRTDGFVLARTIRDLARQFDAEVVVAHSLGALATSFALHEGTALEGVVLLAPAVRLEDAFNRFATRLRLPRRAIAGLRAAMERRYGRNVWSTLEIDRHAAAIAVPALIVHDREDRQVKIDEARRLAAAWSGARLVETSGLGHRRLLDDPEVTALVTDFVVGLELRRRVSA